MIDSFLTGSRAFGEPTDKSDWDVVVRMSHETAGFLSEAPNNDAMYDLHFADATSFRFGDLNLIACFTDEEFDRWRSAKDRCEAEKPVGRARAVTIHKEEGVGKKSQNIESMRPHAIRQERAMANECVNCLERIGLLAKVRDMVLSAYRDCDERMRLASMNGDYQELRLAEVEKQEASFWLNKIDHAMAEHKSENPTDESD